MTATNIRICRTCKWHRWRWVSWSYGDSYWDDICVFPNHYSPVTGEKTPEWGALPCDNMRSGKPYLFRNDCGPEGKNWEFGKNNIAPPERLGCLESIYSMFFRSLDVEKRVK